MWNLTSSIASTVKWIMLQSTLPGSGLFFFFLHYRKSEAGETNKEVCGAKAASVHSGGPRLCGGRPPGGGRHAVLLVHRFAQEFMRLLVVSHDFHS